jgi:hypothetical protein
MDELTSETGERFLWVKAQAKKGVMSAQVIIKMLH